MVASHTRYPFLFRLAVLVYRCLHGLAPSYLAAELHRVSDVDSRSRLRLTSSAALIVRPTLRSSIGDRSFPDAAAVLHALGTVFRRL